MHILYYCVDGFLWPNMLFIRSIKDAIFMAYVQIRQNKNMRMYETSIVSCAGVVLL